MEDFCADDLSDDDVFFGKMTLKEVKKHIWLNHGKNRMSNIKQEPADCNSTIHIIESHSQPNLRTTSLDSTPILVNAGDHRKSEESFIKMENMVSKLCISPTKAVELDNTFEMVEYILNNGPLLDAKPPETENHHSNSPQQSLNVKKEIESCEKNNLTPKKEIVGIEMAPTKLSTIKEKDSRAIKSPLQKIKVELLTPKAATPVPAFAKSTTKNIQVKTEHQTSPTPSKLASPKYFTPCKSPRKQEDIFHTPSINLLKPKTPIFKTPANPTSMKKQSATLLKFTPSKSPMYKHIRSPIASYIKGSIEVPMVSNVCPKKPLPGTSMIPKLVKSSTTSNIGNKENVNIPNTVFKSAKKTKVIPAPVEKPASNSAKKLLSTLPQPPVILKHETREFSSARKPLLNLQEDSVADLSCVQADVSVCTQMKPRKQ